MELWIRSQDKMILSKISNLKIVEDISVSPNSTVVYPACIINETGEILGDYRNTKRALEVLDEMQKRLKNNISYKKNSLYLSNGYNYFEIPYEESSQVYEMPQD